MIVGVFVFQQFSAVVGGFGDFFEGFDCNLGFGDVFGFFWRLSVVISLSFSVVVDVCRCFRQNLGEFLAIVGGFGGCQRFRQRFLEVVGYIGGISVGFRKFRP